MFEAARIAVLATRRREEAGRVHYTVLNTGETTWFLCGPFAARAEAEALVPEMRWAIGRFDRFVDFYGYFTTLSVPEAEPYWTVRFPELGKPVTSTKPAKRRTRKKRSGEVCEPNELSLSGGLAMKPVDRDNLEPAVRAELERLEAERDALLAVCTKLAKLKTGPTAATRGAWIDKVLALATEARAALGGQ